MKTRTSHCDDGTCAADHPRLTPRKLVGLLNLTAFALGLASSTPCISADAYVTDQQGFNFRSGESTRYRIISQLKSGTAVNVISENKRTGYSKVRLSDGTEGFIRSRYLQDEPTASLQLRKAKERLAELEQSPSSLALMLADARRELADVKRENQSNLTSLRAAEAELKKIRAASENAVRLMEEHKVLETKVSYLQKLTSELKRTHAALHADRNFRWMAFGAAILGIGIFIGIAMRRLASNAGNTPR